MDGVIQEPSVAYAVSSGTTLTFTAAPSSNSGNNIFVYYLFRTVGTVSHPSNNALTATNGTLTGTLDVTGAVTANAGVTVDNITIDGNDISSTNSDGDIIFKGNDGGSTITALTLDMSEAGQATFNSSIVVADTVSISSSNVNSFVQAGDNIFQIGTSSASRFYILCQ